MMRFRSLRPRCSCKGRKAAAKGFSLVEVAVATAIVGVGIAALMTSISSGTIVNSSGQKLTQANFLAQEIREWTLRLPFKDPDVGDASNPPGPDGTNPQTFVDDFDDLYDINGLTFNPPRDGTGSPISNLAGWSQTLKLSWRDGSNLRSTVSPGSSDFIYVEVIVSLQNQPVLTTGWLVSRRTT